MSKGLGHVPGGTAIPKFNAPINRSRKAAKPFRWMIVAQIGNELRDYYISAPLPPDPDTARKALGIPEHVEIVVGTP